MDHEKTKVSSISTYENYTRLIEAFPFSCLFCKFPNFINTQIRFMKRPEDDVKQARKKQQQQQ